MRVFFLFLGYALGFAFAASGEWVSRLLAFLVALAFFALSFARKTTKPFLLSLSIGLLVGFLLPFPIPLGRSNLLGMVVKRGENYLILQGMRGKVYVALREHSYQIGDWVKIEGEIENLYMTNYESRFDFGVYLRRLGVEKQMRNGTVLSDFRFPIRVIEWEKKYLQSYDNTTSTLLSSILFNRRDETQGILRLLSDSNLLYLFSASGIIFGKTLSFARVLIRKFTSKDRVADACLLLLAFLFLPLAARKIGIAKVLVVHSVSFLSLHVLKRAWSRLEILSVSALLMAIVSPFSLFQTGFLLSFGISFSFYFCQGLFPKGLSAFARNLRSVCFVQALVLPVTLHSAGSLHLFTPLFSLLLTPLLVPFAILGWVGYFSFPLPSLLHPYGRFLSLFVELCGQVDYRFALPPWGKLFGFLYYAALFLFLFASEIRFPSLQKALPLGFVFFHSLSLLPILAPFTQGVYFLNVGQGDAILVRDRFTTVLIDTGGNLGFDMAEEVLIPFFRKERIYRIDCLIASHHDFDHIGAKESLEASFPVRAFVDDPSSFPLEVGDLRFENFNVFPAEEENDASLVLKLDFMDRKWLFTGDAPTRIEKEILRSGADVDCDVLKVGHHGSSTSTSEDFLRACSPEEAVVSVGRNNAYGHPSPAVIARLSSRGIKIRRTDFEGTIRYAKWTSPWV